MSDFALRALTHPTPSDRGGYDVNVRRGVPPSVVRRVVTNRKQEIERAILGNAAWLRILSGIAFVAQDRRQVISQGKERAMKNGLMHLPRAVVTVIILLMAT